MYAFDFCVGQATKKIYLMHNALKLAHGKMSSKNA
jgi:hypothetical protein